MLTLSELPISKIKVRIPQRRRELITRPRLLDALYEHLDKRLLLIVAPAGYGKTSLLVDLAQQSELAVCWLSLDALDRDTQRFLRYVIAAISERFPGFGRDSLAALANMATVEQDEEELFITITNEINTQINEHFILILDDYHLVSSAASINHMVSRLLRLTGEHVHLLLATRTPPDLPDASLMIARNQVGDLSFKELSFCPEEIQQLFQQNNGILLSQEDAQVLVKETEGWIAAIHLTNGRPGTLPQMHPLESTRELFDFFLKEVLLRQPEQVRRFMLMTSMFDTFDISLCRRALEPLVAGEYFDWPILFETVRAGNLFSVPLDNDGRWMRYHHLFQHFLRSKLQYEQPVLARRVRHNLARAYEEQKLWEEALEIYAEMGDRENQIRLLMEAGSDFIRAGRALTLESWLNKLSSEEIYSRPALVSLLGVIYCIREEARRALELFNLAEADLRESGDNVEWTKALVRRAEVYRQDGQFECALEDLDKALELTQGSSNREMQETFAESQRIKGLVLLVLGHMEEALTWLQGALQTNRLLGASLAIPILETELGVVYRRLGEIEFAAQYYASALQALENVGNISWKARLLNNLGMLCHMTGRLEEAYSLFEDAVKMSERSGYLGIQINAMISLADLLTDLFDYASADIYYENALTLATNLHRPLFVFHAFLGQARVQRLNGNHLLARDDLKRAEPLLANVGVFERAFFNLELGCCCLESNQLDPGIEALRNATVFFDQGGNSRERMVAQLWLEVAASIQNLDGATHRLKELIPAQRDWQKPTLQMIHAGRVNCWLKKQGNFSFKDPVLKLFFEQAECIQESLPELRRNIRTINEKPSAVAPQLEITSFGDVMVCRNQRVVELSDWQTREARDLFFFLLQSPALTKEQIALVFWPDISPARLKVRFKINIYRIRRAIGQDAIVFEDDRYRFNRAINYCWDREEFDKLFEKLRQNIVQSEKRKLLAQAVGLLRGDYLADLDADWVVIDRLKYQEHYRYVMLELAAIYLQGGQAHDCLNIARQILLSDPLLESAHRLIIQAYASLHDPANMTLQYRQYQQMLENELGLAPSLEIRSLYEQLMTIV